MIHHLRGGARRSKEGAADQSQKGIKAGSIIVRAKRHEISSGRKAMKTEIYIPMRRNVVDASNISTLMVNCALKDHLVTGLRVRLRIETRIISGPAHTTNQNTNMQVLKRTKALPEEQSSIKITNGTATKIEMTQIMRTIAHLRSLATVTT